ncbi:MAG: OmpA family protein [bacterium]|nr:OmpA family protein [bacterium]
MNIDPKYHTQRYSTLSKKFNYHVKHSRFFIILFLGTLFFSFFTLTALVKEPLNSKKLTNLGPTVNSTGDDFCPSITADGKIMVYDSRLPTESDHNIFLSRFEDGRWTKPEYLEEINSGANDETPYITPDGSTIIFASDRRGSWWPPVTSDGKVRITYDLYISELVNGKWTKPEWIPGNANSIKNERTPSLSSDQKYLYFTRWPFKKLYKSKIMRATLRDGYYTDIKELPSIINSGNYDLAFTPSHDKAGFYFSSRRPGGYGGWDIYFIHYKNERFRDLINLGPGINSDDNEMFLTEIRNRIYLCSNRPGGLGEYDIYTALLSGRITTRKYRKKIDTGTRETPVRIKIKKDTASDTKIEPPVKKDTGPSKRRRYARPFVKKSKKSTLMKFTALNSKSQKPQRAKFIVYLKKSSKGKPVRIITKRSDAEGQFKIRPKTDVNWVVLKADHKKYQPFSERIEIRKRETSDYVLELVPKKKKPASKTKKEPVKKKEPVVRKKPSKTVFRPVYFGKGSSTINLEYFPYLHKMINSLRENKKVRIKIIGHAYKEGSAKECYKLSITRAKAVRDYLVKLKLPKRRFIVIGMGIKDPMVVKEGKKLADMNRRVEFRIWR